jgi:hypothetical protein
MTSVFFHRRPHFFPCLLAAALLLAALGSWPYVYYRLLRWLVCAVAVYVACVAFLNRRKKLDLGGDFWRSLAFIPMALLFISVAILFNPFAPFHLKRYELTEIDIWIGLIFATAALVPTRPFKPSSKEENIRDAEYPSNWWWILFCILISLFVALAIGTLGVFPDAD